MWRESPTSILFAAFVKESGKEVIGGGWVELQEKPKAKI